MEDIPGGAQAAAPEELEGDIPFQAEEAAEREARQAGAAAEWEAHQAQAAMA
ncbi:MAG: hypothetical protein LIO76_01805 [Clostridiales bacterium]|nr:hypothetical protein [Clostridiales bacterium]